ncbi:LytR C-terminal domain-containing protein [Streptomyces reniochalinae]|uniref:LytR family transcriptional regulator n=1 Tax=Streptomyces reniochalinae TaxID=2250578 RepID=A0A367E782_9ACTN|nr:LytR C-terminal domain-containing protein [Streptomyces reniochalinae]RCG13555.1 LytR family transcriptional regulator [Streptomyces reniochalinae]
MSMLTPPGLGGKYRIRGDRYPRMRRPRRRGRILAVSLSGAAALAVLGWGTLQLVDIFSADEPARASDHRRAKAADCASPAAAVRPGARDGAHLPKPGDVTVNVLNATSRTGLAKDTADELEKRGFTVGKVANAPAGLAKEVKGTGFLIGAPGAKNTARLKTLATQLKGEEIRYDERDGDALDLVLGKKFTELTEEKAATAALAGPAAPGASASTPHDPTTC